MTVTVLNVQAAFTSSSSSVKTIPSYVVPAGDDKILIVDAGDEFDGTSNNVTGVTHNGVALEFAERGEFDGTWLNTAEIWYLLLGSTTPSGDIVVTWGSTNRLTTVIAATVTGLVQQAPEVVNNSGVQTTSVSTSVTTLTEGAFIVDSVIYGENNVISIDDGPEQILDYSDNFAGNTAAHGMSHELAGSIGSYTLGWSGISQRWGQAVAVFEAVASSQINTRAKRLSMLNFRSRGRLLPDPNTSGVDQGERQTFLNKYSGVLFAGGAPPTGRIMSSLAAAGGLAYHGGIAGKGGGLAG